MYNSVSYEEALNWLNNSTIITNDDTNRTFFSLLIGTGSLGIAGYFGKYSLNQDCSVLSFNEAMRELDGWQCSLAILSAGLIIEGSFLMITQVLISSYNIFFNNFNDNYDLRVDRWTHVGNLTHWHIQMKNLGFESSLLNLDNSRYELIDGSLFGFNSSSLIYNSKLEKNFVLQHGMSSSRLFMAENNNKYIFKGYICTQLDISWDDVENLEPNYINVTIDDEWAENGICNCL